MAFRVMGVASSRASTGSGSVALRDRAELLVPEFEVLCVGALVAAAWLQHRDTVEALEATAQHWAVDCRRAGDARCGRRPPGRYRVPAIVGRWGPRRARCRRRPSRSPLAYDPDDVAAGRSDASRMWQTAQRVVCARSRAARNRCWCSRTIASRVA